MSIKDFVIYDPQSHTHEREHLYIGGLGAYLAEHEGETVAEFFNPKRGIIITNRPYGELEYMRDAYETITRGEPKHNELINANSRYKKSFTIFGTCYHTLRCCAVPESAIHIVFNFDSDTVAWIFDVLDEIYGEDKAYENFHGPRAECYAIGW